MSSARISGCPLILYNQIMAVEKRKYFLGIIPGKREPAPPKDVELRSPKLSGEIIGIMVYSSDSFTVFRDSSHQ